MISGFCNPTLPRTGNPGGYDPHLRCRGCDCAAKGCPCRSTSRDAIPTMTPEEAMEALL